MAVIDDGVAYSHPDLTDNMWDGSACVDENNVTVVGGCMHGYNYDAVGTDTNDPMPNDTDGNGDNSHGTHIAGIIAAEEDGIAGVVGVAPNAKIMAIKMTSFTTEEELEAIAFAKNNGAKIINASFGAYEEDSLEEAAINSFDGLFIASAVNHGTDNDSDGHIYPCDYALDNIICVAATDQNDELASFSNYGAQSVDVGAPGVDIYSAVAYDIAQSQDFSSDFPVTWTKTGDFGVVGGALIGDTNQSPYLDNADSIATSETYDLSVYGAVNLSFETTCDTEYSNSDWTDYMLLDVSSDGGTGWTAEAMWDEESIDEINGDVSEEGSATYQVNVALDSSYMTDGFFYLDLIG